MLNRLGHQLCPLAAAGQARSFNRLSGILCDGSQTASVGVVAVLLVAGYVTGHIFSLSLSSRLLGCGIGKTVTGDTACVPTGLNGYTTWASWRRDSSAQRHLDAVAEPLAKDDDRDPGESELSITRAPARGCAVRCLRSLRVPFLAGGLSQRPA
jgi:hypothetical protein